VRFSASGDATRGPLTCVCFRDRHALSGDDSRASRFTLNKAAPEPFLLPASSADILLKVPRFGLLAVDRYFLEREKESPRCRIHFRGEELLFSAESTTGEYPAWVAALFETRPPSWMIELPEGLAKAAKAGWELVAPTDSEFEGDTKVTLGFEGRKVTILARGMKEGDSRHFNAEFVLPHAVEEPLTLEVRPRHLYEALRRFRAMSPPYAATIEGRAATAVSFHSGGSGTWWCWIRRVEAVPVRPETPRSARQTGSRLNFRPRRRIPLLTGGPQFAPRPKTSASSRR